MPTITGGRFVVAGGASQLGSHIGEQLLAAGAREVVLLDNLSLGSTHNIDFLLSDTRCSFVRGDVLRLNELYDPFATVDGVFLVAGFLGVPLSANPWMGIDVNVRGAHNVLEACRYQGVRKVIFSSTIGVYGAVGDEPNSEDSPLRWQDSSPPVILYCASKIMGEGLGRLYQQQHGIDFVALRYAAVYGERMHTRGIVATRILEAHRRIRSGQRPRIDGDGTSVDDYIYVGDVARANLMAMESSASGDGMNIVSGEDTSERRIVELVVEACESDLEPEYYDDPTKIKVAPATKRGYSRERAKRLIGWEPRVSLDEGVRRVVAWLDRERATKAL